MIIDLTLRLILWASRTQMKLPPLFHWTDTDRIDEVDKGRTPKSPPRIKTAKPSVNDLAGIWKISLLKRPLWVMSSTNLPKLYGTLHNSKKNMPLYRRYIITVS